MSGRSAPQMTEVQLLRAHQRIFTEAEWLEYTHCPCTLATPAEIALVCTLSLVCIAIPLICAFRLHRIVRWLRQDLAELKLRRVGTHNVD